MISQEPQSNCKVGVCRPCGKNNSAMEPGHWPRQLITEVLGLELRTVAPKPLTPPFASSPPRISASLLLLCLLEAPSCSLSNCAWGSWEGLLRCLGRKGGSAEAPPCNHFPLSTFFSTVGVSLKKKKKKKKPFLVPLPKQIMITLNRASAGSHILPPCLLTHSTGEETEALTQKRLAQGHTVSK